MVNNYHLASKGVRVMKVMTNVNKFPTEYGPLSNNPLSLLLQIHCVDWLAGSFSRTSCSPITSDHTDLYTV